MIRTVKAILLPAFLGALILYFSYHALAGDQGLAAWAALQQREDQLRADLEALKAEQEVLQTSLARLRESTLDLDYVEELARAKLSYARPDEVLVATR